MTMIDPAWSATGVPVNIEAALADTLRALKQFADAFVPLTDRQRAEKLLLGRVLDNARLFLPGDTTTPIVPAAPVEIVDEPDPVLLGFIRGRRKVQTEACQRLRGEGWTQEAIAGELEVSVSVVRRMLKRGSEAIVCEAIPISDAVRKSLTADVEKIG